MNISTFSFPTKVRFGAGAISGLPGHAADLEMANPLIVTDPGLLSTSAFATLERVLAGRCGVFAEVHPNPVEADVEGAARAYAAAQCDGVVAIGGGSALDVGKAVRLRVRRPEKTLQDFDSNERWNDLVPFIAIPTTAGTGSEVGRSAVIIIHGRKRVLFHPSLLAALVILDPELTRDLPSHLTAATGADALTHCIESFTSTVFHPLCDGIALEGIHLISRALLHAVENGGDLEARGLMQVAAMMGGIAFQKDLGAVHSLAHPLSSVCGLHHGLANALCLTQVMEFNAARVPGLYQRIGVALGIQDPSDSATIGAVRRLLDGIGLNGGLRSHGVDESHIDALVAQAVEDGCHLTNPTPVTEEDFRDLYMRSL